MALILTCTSLANNGACQGAELVDGYILPADSAAMLQLLLAGDIDPVFIEIGFGGVISLFIAGLTVGIIINIIRKLRNP